MHTWSEMQACVPPSTSGPTKKGIRCPPLRFLLHVLAQPTSGTIFARSFWSAEYLLHLRHTSAEFRGNSRFWAHQKGHPMPPLRFLPYMQAQPNFGTKFAWSFCTAEYLLHLRDAPAALRGNCDASEILGPCWAQLCPRAGLVHEDLIAACSEVAN